MTDDWHDRQQRAVISAGSLAKGLAVDLPQGKTWREHLANLGFTYADAGADATEQHWTEMHEWCHKQFGDRYTWTGSRFWFNDERDAILFIIKWGS